MANTTVIHQPGISYQKEYSGSVQYIGGYEGPYVDNEDVFVKQDPGSSNHIIPIPMGLEVFENVSKFVAHQNVAKEDGKLVFIVRSFFISPFIKDCYSKIGQLV